ncbi:MAG: GHKL domain-containing protein [Alphaproteobacteria bacterium]|nr:GHKL domain-containing protein [Alphaproteobacteria bacterium]
MKSIQKQLMLSILAIICLSTVIMVAITYYELKEELDELFDENMVQVAQAIAVHELAQKTQIPQGQGTRNKLKGEEEFLIQIWDKDTLTYSSLPALALPYQGEGGVRTIIHDHQEWRYYGLSQGDWLIQVSQPLPERHSVIWEIYSEILIPMLVQFPILLGVIWFFVGYGFRPLGQISSSIEKRSSVFLDKLPEDNVPQEVSAMVGALNDLFERLDKALKTQRRFTADAAHELRTPLTAVMLQLDILRRAKSEEEKQEAVKELYKGVERSTHLVQQLLELARQEPDATGLPFERCDLQDVLEDVLEHYKLLARDKHITLKTSNSKRAHIQGDKNALSIMIGNLLNNAILYTQNGGMVSLSITAAPGRVMLSVSDNGPGIPEEEIPRIFDRFYRVVGTKTTGSGLGLSIVKTIAEHHNAAITLEQGLEGRGTTFKLVFPA